MLESLKRNEQFEYQKLSPEEMKARGILGRLVGPCADFINPTRNGRKYSEELWENVFNDPIVQEKISNGVCFGELGHPADRTETDMEKIAVCLREAPKKNSKGQLEACFDILDTPNGRILKTLCDYGTTIGISSRGQGDIIDNGECEEVDPETYDFECFDVVLVPAVESARLNYVTEGLDKNTLNLKKALVEDLNKADDKAKKIMQETLENLSIKLDETKEECNDENRTDITESETPKQTDIKEVEANNDGAKELIESLKAALKDKTELDGQVKALQEKLAVTEGKVNELQEELNKRVDASSKVATLVKESKEMTDKASTLERQLKEKQILIDSQVRLISKLKESRKSAESKHTTLEESVSKKDAEIKVLNEQFDEIKKENEAKIQELTESLENLKSESATKEADYCSKLQKETNLKESYKKLAENVVHSYIETKAGMLGVSANEIINKLPGKYSIKDIDSICEELQSYELNIGKLPFNVGRNTKVKVTESKNEPLPNIASNPDDEIDDDLLKLAGMK